MRGIFYSIIPCVCFVMHWSFDQSIDQVYQSLTAAQIIARVANEGLRPPVPPRCPWNHVMQMCWHEDPAARPTFEQILLELKHVFSQQSTAPFGPQPVRYPPASYLSSSSSGGSEGREGSGLDGGGRNLHQQQRHYEQDANSSGTKGLAVELTPVGTSDRLPQGAAASFAAPSGGGAGGGGGGLGVPAVTATTPQLSDTSPLLGASLASAAAGGGQQSQQQQQSRGGYGYGGVGR
jgi:hypothetical protein